MVEVVLRENAAYRVELYEDTSRIHQPHRSWGTYRVVERKSSRVLFTSANGDKTLGVFEYLTEVASPR